MSKFSAKLMEQVLLGKAKIEVVTEQKRVYEEQKPGCSLCAAEQTAAGGKLLVCGGCKVVRYCSKEHQRPHWKSAHKKKCAQVRKNLEDGEETTMLTKLREKARSRKTQGKYAEAAKLLEKVVKKSRKLVREGKLKELNPEFYAVQYLNLADCYEHMEDSVYEWRTSLEKAVEAVEGKPCEVRSVYEAVFAQSGRLYAEFGSPQAGDDDEALMLYKKGEPYTTYRHFANWARHRSRIAIRQEDFKTAFKFAKDLLDRCEENERNPTEKDGYPYELDRVTALRLCAVAAAGLEDVPDCLNYGTKAVERLDFKVSCTRSLRILDIELMGALTKANILVRRHDEAVRCLRQLELRGANYVPKVFYEIRDKLTPLWKERFGEDIPEPKHKFLKGVW